MSVALDHVTRTVDGIESVDVAGPGFLNVTLAAGTLGAVAKEIVTAGGSYGRSNDLAGQRINLEFVSANPTGPVHLGHTRWAALGDSLHRLLEAAGADVVAEHYINDFGSQLGKFGVTANAIAPGFIQTEMTKATAERMGIPFEDFIKGAASQIPVQRVGQPEDIAHLVSFLVSEGAGFVSGQVIYAAGGPRA